MCARRSCARHPTSLPDHAFTDAVLNGEVANNARSCDAAWLNPRLRRGHQQNPYLPLTTPNSEVCPNPTSAPATPTPLARASAATAVATAGATSRLKTEGMM